MRKGLRPQEVSTKDMEIVNEVCEVLKKRCTTDIYALRILTLARMVILEGSDSVKVTGNKSERPSG
jgi:hypothetical protein